MLYAIFNSSLKVPVAFLLLILKAAENESVLHMSHIPLRFLLLSEDKLRYSNQTHLHLAHQTILNHLLFLPACAFLYTYIYIFDQPLNHKIAGIFLTHLKDFLKSWLSVFLRYLLHTTVIRPPHGKSLVLLNLGLIFVQAHYRLCE